MKKFLLCALAVTAWLVPSDGALGDPASAIRAYDAGLYDLAANEFQRGAAAGDVESQYRLGCMYADGIWFKADRDKAVEWLGKAAIAGHEGATRKLEQINKPAGKAR